MAITSNSGTTFIGAGGAVGVQINTNTNWRFYLTGSTGAPDWLRIHGNVSEITGSQSQTIMCEADANTTSAARSASGICISTSEPNLTGWTGFWQLTGDTGGGGKVADYYGYLAIIDGRNFSSLDAGKTFSIRYSLFNDYTTMVSKTKNYNISRSANGNFGLTTYSTYGNVNSEPYDYSTQPTGLYIKVTWPSTSKNYTIYYDVDGGFFAGSGYLTSADSGQWRPICYQYPSIQSDAVQVVTYDDTFYQAVVRFTVEQD